MKRLEGSLRFQRGCLLPKYHQAVDVGSPPQGGLIMCPCCLKNYICHTSIWAKCVAVVWLLSRFLLWDTMTAACQASLSFTISQSLLKFMFIESVMLSNHLIVFCSSPLAFNLSQHQGLFQWVGSLHQVAKVLELLLSTKPQAKLGWHQARY